jgi:hypothetical protein
LDEIIEDAQALRILRFGDIDERTNLGGLSGTVWSAFWKQKEAKDYTYLKRNVFTTQPNLQLLSSILILLRPLAIIFPILL